MSTALDVGRLRLVPDNPVMARSPTQGDESHLSHRIRKRVSTGATRASHPAGGLATE